MARFRLRFYRLQQFVQRYSVGYDQVGGGAITVAGMSCSNTSISVLNTSEVGLRTGVRPIPNVYTVASMLSQVHGGNKSTLFCKTGTAHKISFLQEEQEGGSISHMTNALRCRIPPTYLRYPWRWSYHLFTHRRGPVVKWFATHNSKSDIGQQMH